MASNVWILAFGTCIWSGDPKIMAEVLNTLPRVKGVRTCILHLEEKEIFGGTKRKLGIIIGDVRDSHWPNKVNLFQPCVQSKSSMAFVESS